MRRCDFKKSLFCLLLCEKTFYTAIALTSHKLTGLNLVLV